MKIIFAYILLLIAICTSICSFAANKEKQKKNSVNIYNFKPPFDPMYDVVVTPDTPESFEFSGKNMLNNNFSGRIIRNFAQIPEPGMSTLSSKGVRIFLSKPLAFLDDDSLTYFYPKNSPVFTGNDQDNLPIWLAHMLGRSFSLYSIKEGDVLATFIVEKDGTISNVELMKSLYKRKDAESLMFLYLSPKWIAASSNGQSLSVRYYISFYYTPSLDIYEGSSEERKAKREAKKALKEK